MAKKAIQQVVEDDDLLEASAETEEIDEEQLDEFQADATGGDTFKGAASADPVTPSGGGGSATTSATAPAIRVKAVCHSSSVLVNNT